MKKEINELEINKMNHYSAIYSIFLVLMVVSVIPCMKWMGWLGMIPVAFLFVCTLYFAWKIERLKKNNNVFTYKEIVAFTEGKMLDEIEQQVEKGKRPYQRFMLALGSGVVAAAVCLFLGWLLL